MMIYGHFLIISYILFSAYYSASQSLVLRNRIPFSHQNTEYLAIVYLLSFEKSHITKMTTDNYPKDSGPPLKHFFVQSYIMLSTDDL